MKSGKIAAGEKILLTLWVGGLWFAGYVVAPVLFQLLDKKTAGMVAGQIFTVTSYIGLFCGGFLLISIWLDSAANKLHNYRLWIIVSMLILILIGQFVLSPMMVELKQAGLSDAESASQFARLHGLSSSLFLVNSVLGLVLVVAGLRPAKQIFN